jgi:hypothetical protein
VGNFKGVSKVVIEEHKELKPDTRKLTVLSASQLDLAEDDKGMSSHCGQSASIRIPEDSYIILFSGRRGGGKTTLMTFFAARLMAWQNMRVLSNYPIEFMLARTINGHVRYFRKVSEPLDLGKLLAFDADYRKCLIVMDEAPDIISNLASMTWKNRLLNIFVRQLRKNQNSLFLAAQSIGFIDKSLHWQVDLEVECEDAAKKYQGSHLTKGSIILARWLDHSGQWTGQSTEQRVASAKANHEYGDIAAVDHTELHAKRLWGDKAHRPVFNTLFQQDVWESLRRVDMRLNTFKVGDRNSAASVNKFPVSTRILSSAANFISEVLEHAGPKGEPTIYQTDFFKSLGAISEQDRNNLGKTLTNFNVARAGDSRTRYYDFSEFDIAGFKTFTESQQKENAS